MLISVTFLSLVNLLTKEGAFLLYAAFGAIGFVYIWIALPETKGELECDCRNRNHCA